MYLDASTVDNRRGKERSWTEVLVHTRGHGREVEEVGNLALDERCDGSDVNLAVAKRLDALLRFLGRDTVLTRTEDVSVYTEGAETLRQKKASDLKNRVALVNAIPNAVLVSIHQNSLPSVPSVRGAQVFYGAAEPVVGTLVGIFIFHEESNFMKIAGILMVITAILLIGRDETENK